MCLTLLGGGGVSAKSDNVCLLARFVSQDGPQVYQSGSSAASFNWQVASCQLKFANCKVAKFSLFLLATLVVGVVKNKSCSVQFICLKSPGIPVMVIPPPTTHTHTIPAGDGDPSKEMNMFACACGTWTWCNRLIDSSNPNYQIYLSELHLICRIHALKIS